MFVSGLSARVICYSSMIYKITINDRVQRRRKKVKKTKKKCLNLWGGVGATGYLCVRGIESLPSTFGDKDYDKSVKNNGGDTVFFFFFMIFVYRAPVVVLLSSSVCLKCARQWVFENYFISESRT